MSQLFFSVRISSSSCCNLLGTMQDQRPAKKGARLKSREESEPRTPILQRLWADDGRFENCPGKMILDKIRNCTCGNISKNKVIGCE